MRIPNNVFCIIISYAPFYFYLFFVSMNDTDKQFLLYLARESILSELEGRNCSMDRERISNTLQQNRGVFVTLTLNGELRGCIGHLVPIQELYKDVIENARSAAFMDPRFMPLTKDEFQEVAIEISILNESEALQYESVQDLLEKLEKSKPGVILEKGNTMATFLPQVWEELTHVEDFLSHLCVKAGLVSNEWTKGEIKIKTYTVEKISEEK